VIKEKKILLPSGMDLKDWMNNLINYNRVRETVSNKKAELVSRGLSTSLIDDVLRVGEVAWAKLSDGDKKSIKELTDSQNDLEKVTLEMLNEVLNKLAVRQTTQEHLANAAEILSLLQKNKPNDIKDAVNDPAKEETLEKAFGIIGFTGRDWDKKSLTELMQALKAKDFNDFMAKIINRLSMMNELEGQINQAQEKLDKADSDKDKQKLREEIYRLNAKKELLLLNQTLVTEGMVKKAEGLFQKVTRWFVELFCPTEKDRRIKREGIQEALKPMRVTFRILGILDAKGLKPADLDNLNLDQNTRIMVKRYIEDARYPGVGIKDKNVYVIDGRMGGLQLEIYCCPSSIYETTLVNPNNVSHDSCTARSICFNCAIIGGLIANFVRLYVNKELTNQELIFGFNDLSLLKANL